MSELELKIVKLISVTAFFNSLEDANSIVGQLKDQNMSVEIKKTQFNNGVFVIFKGLEDSLDLNMFKKCSRFSYREGE